jgi:hypothetical protein
MKTLIKLSLGLVLIFSSSNIFSQSRLAKSHRASRHGKVIVVKPNKMGKWQNLGSKRVNFKLDSDQLLVTAYEGVFRQIKFKVTKAPIHLNFLTIVFSNGENKHINVNRNFKPGDTSKIIDLPGNRRIIKKINFNYKTINSGKVKSKVTIWGLH